MKDLLFGWLLRGHCDFRVLDGMMMLVELLGLLWALCYFAIKSLDKKEKKL